MFSFLMVGKDKMILYFITFVFAFQYLLAKNGKNRKGKAIDVWCKLTDDTFTKYHKISKQLMKNLQYIVFCLLQNVKMCGMI